MRPHPFLLEANATILLRRLSGKHRKRLSLDTVPAGEWQEIARSGFDLLWLMGLWTRSPASRRQALSVPELRSEFRSVLPDWTEEDVLGSPYAVRCYDPDPGLGDRAALTALRRRLNDSGLALIVDFVPNHTATDHPWIGEHPDRFVRGTKKAVREHPEWFFSPAPGIHIAHGRDPYFPPWTDTAQVDFLSAAAREGLIRELLAVAECADGVRCDMAMLAIQRVFRKTWDGTRRGGKPSGDEFWPEAIGRVKSRWPRFLFIAEAYWDLEEDLLRMGFDFAYDKTSYDRLRSGNATEIPPHLLHRNILVNRGVRFIENHDEPRAAAAFGPAPSRSAAVVVFTLPGMRMFHDGQREGRRIRLPVQLGREPGEPVDDELPGFYDRLLGACRSEIFHKGDWRLEEVKPAGPDGESDQKILAWSWWTDNDFRLVVVNHSPRPAAGILPASAHRQASDLRDELDATPGPPSGIATHRSGLSVSIESWGSRILRPA